MKRLQLSVEEDIEGLELSGRPWRNDQEVDLLRSTKFFLGLLVTEPGVYQQDCFASFIRLENFLDPCLCELTGHEPALDAKQPTLSAEMSELQTRRILQDQTGAISVSGGSHLNLVNGC
ncbi:hypothetical protein L596_012034 [Steinernema carpocapsae]|uniref:Uncharacterized protein n=1 Tax=Steinernema carpocapsae TaxID=34508 RepID=A0A4U5NWM8_STECR|nr:hypothetical protein L596_012034 [Steinernema carpocapsae]